MAARLIEFGLSIPVSALAGSDPVAAAIRAEALGFDFVSASDHPEGTTASFEVWTMLCFIAAATSRIKVATRVLGAPYRSPAVVAKMAESLSRLSGGRLILGLGAGSADDEHRAFGLGVRTAKEKTDGLEEAVTVIRGLWTQTDFTFDGRVYQTDVANLEPKPVHPIPIWLGTFAPRALAVTGRLADGWIPSHGYMPDDELPKMRQRVLTAARRAGRDPAEIRCVYNIAVHLGGDLPEEPDVLSETADKLVERLLGYQDIGFSGFNFSLVGPNTFEQAEQIARDVIPALRS